MQRATGLRAGWGKSMQRRDFVLGAAALTAAGAARAQDQQRANPLNAAFEYSADRGGAGVIVTRSGITLGERFERNTDTPCPLGTATQAFLPILVGSLARDELLTMDEPVAMTLGDWGAHPLKSTISIRQLVNGTSGMVQATPDMDLMSLLAAEPVSPPGDSFSNDPALYRIFAEVARRKLESSGRGSDIAAYMSGRTLSVIGCAPITFATRPGEAARLDDGATTTASGLRAAGELIQRRGVYRANPLLDSAVVTSAMQGSFAQQRRGVGLWLAQGGAARPNEPVASDLWTMGNRLPIDLACAIGANGARLFVIPSERTVIVRLANSESSREWSDAAFLNLILGRV